MLVRANQLISFFLLPKAPTTDTDDQMFSAVTPAQAQFISALLVTLITTYRQGAERNKPEKNNKQCRPSLYRLPVLSQLVMVTETPDLCFPAPLSFTAKLHWCTKVVCLKCKTLCLPLLNVLRFLSAPSSNWPRPLAWQPWLLPSCISHLPQFDVFCELEDTICSIVQVIKESIK